MTPLNRIVKENMEIWERLSASKLSLNYVDKFSTFTQDMEDLKDKLNLGQKYEVRASGPDD